jgi:hypothetical protein
MSVKQTNRTTHSEPIYMVELLPTAAGTLLVTNTQSGRAQTGPDGFPVQYRQTINLESGAVTCFCPGFQSAVAVRAQRDGVAPTIYNHRDCKHIRKAAESGREWGYIADEKPLIFADVLNIADGNIEAPAAFDWVAHFES